MSKHMSKMAEENDRLKAENQELKKTIDSLKNTLALLSGVPMAPILPKTLYSPDEPVYDEGYDDRHSDHHAYDWR